MFSVPNQKEKPAVKYRPHTTKHPVQQITLLAQGVEGKHASTLSVHSLGNAAFTQDIAISLSLKLKCTVLSY